MNDVYKIQLPDGADQSVPQHPSSKEVNDVLTLAEGIRAQCRQTKGRVQHLYWYLEGRPEHLQGLLSKNGELRVLTVHGLESGGTPPTLTIMPGDKQTWRW